MEDIQGLRAAVQGLKARGMSSIRDDPPATDDVTSLPICKQKPCLQNFRLHFKKVVVTVTTKVRSDSDVSPPSHTKLHLQTYIQSMFAPLGVLVGCCCLDVFSSFWVFSRLSILVIFELLVFYCHLDNGVTTH